MSIQIQTNTWSDFKSLVLSKSLLVQYSDSSYAYDVYAVDGQIVYSFSIVKATPAGTDQTDFEANYKTTSNQILDITRVLLSQEVSQLSQLISNTSGEVGALPLETQQVIQLSNLNIAVATEIAQLTTTLLYESQQVGQLSQIITNTGAADIDVRPYLTQEITQLSTLELYGSQEVAQLSTIITNTSTPTGDPRPLLAQEVTQLSNLNAAVVVEVAQLTTLQLYGSQEVAELSTIITNTANSTSAPVVTLLTQEVAQLSLLLAAPDSDAYLAVQQVNQLTNLNLALALEVTQLTTVNTTLVQEVAQLSTLNTSVSTAAKQDAQTTLLAQEVSQLSTIITNTGLESAENVLIVQQVTQLSNLNAAVAVEVSQLTVVNVQLSAQTTQMTTIELYGSQQVAQLSQIVTNTGVAPIDTRSYLSQEITQLSTLELYGSQEVSQLSTIITNTNVAVIDTRPYLSQEIAQLSNLNVAVVVEVTQLTTLQLYGAQEVSQLSQIITNTASSGIDTRPYLSQEITQLSNLNAAVALEVAQLTTVNTTLVQQVAQLTTLNTSNSSQVTLLAQEIIQLTTIQLYGSQEVAQLSQIITNTAASGTDTRPYLSAQITQLSTIELYGSQEVSQLSTIITNTAVTGADPRPLLAQEVTQLSNLNLAVALEVAQLTTINTTLAQEAAQLSTLNTSNNGQVTLLAQEAAQLSTLNTSNSGQVTLLAQEVAQLSNLNAAVSLEVTQLTTLNLYNSQEVTQLSQIITNTGASGIDTRPYLSQEITQLSNLNVAVVLEVSQLSTIISSIINGLSMTGKGTAGTADAGVVTVQGIASGTAVGVSSNSGIFSAKVQLQDNAGAAITLGQKTMASSVPGVIASDQTSIQTTFGKSNGTKTIVMNTGSLVTTATTADQVVATYTVTAAKTFMLEYIGMNGYLTTLPGNSNPVLIGSISLEIVAGNKEITQDIIIGGGGGHPPNFYFVEPMPIAAGTVVRVVCTPAAAASRTWRANFGGYEV